MEEDCKGTTRRLPTPKDWEVAQGIPTRRKRSGAPDYIHIGCECIPWTYKNANSRCDQKILISLDVLYQHVMGRRVVCVRPEHRGRRPDGTVIYYIEKEFVLLEVIHGEKDNKVEPSICKEKDDMGVHEGICGGEQDAA